MKLPDLPTVKCPHCAGSGTMPAPRTGALLRKEREGRGVSRHQLVDNWDYSMSYTFDLERGQRPWTGELVKLYREAIDAAVAERVKEREAMV